MRVRMSQIDRELLFTKAKRRFSTRELGDLVSVSPRTIRSWQSGDTLVRYAAFKKLLVIAGLTEGQVAHKNLPEFWHTKEAGHKGAIAQARLYGNFATAGGRSRGGKTTCRMFARNPELARKKNFGIAKTIIYPPKSEQLAELVGILIGDGGITRYQVRVTHDGTTDTDHAKHVARLFKDVFGITTAFSLPKNKNVCEVVASSRNLVKFLIQIGLKLGNKIRQRVDIPFWIKKDRKFSIACVRGLVDTDGCFYIDRHQIKNRLYKNAGIAFTTYSQPLFNSVHAILESLNFNPTGKTRNLFLRRREEIMKYFQVLGSNNKKHVVKFQDFFSKSG